MRSEAVGTSIMSRCLLFKETETAQDGGCGLNNKKVLGTQYTSQREGTLPFPGLLSPLCQMDLGPSRSWEDGLLHRLPCPRGSDLVSKWLYHLARSGRAVEESWNSQPEVDGCHCNPTPVLGPSYVR